MAKRPSVHSTIISRNSGITVDMRVFAPADTPYQEVLLQMLEAYRLLVDEAGGRWHTQDQSHNSEE